MTMALRDRADLGRIRQDYHVADADAVAELIVREPWLRSMLAEARLEIDTAFCPGVPVDLEVTTDPEEGDSALFARIATALPVEEVLKRLETLWDRWGLETLSQNGGAFHLDYRPV